MSSDLAIGPSAGVVGDIDWDAWSNDMDDLPRLREYVYKYGRHPRAGHNRDRWASVDWTTIRAHVGILGRRGPWRVDMVEDKPNSPGQWVCEADGMPFVPGWYTALIHEQRGLVMSDVPAEVAGALEFLERAQQASWMLIGRRDTALKVLISGLGLGIIPSWLLANASVDRIDVVELDEDVVELVGRDPAAADVWTGDPRLHIHHGDALTWWPTRRPGCALHTDCPPPETWDCAWHDIWDCIQPENLPSMRRLHRRYGRRAGWQLSWERAECEAKAKRPTAPPMTFCMLRDAMDADLAAGRGAWRLDGDIEAGAAALRRAGLLNNAGYLDGDEEDAARTVIDVIRPRIEERQRARIRAAVKAATASPLGPHTVIKLSELDRILDGAQ